MTTDVEEIDKSLEIANLIHASEAGYMRDRRPGTAFGHEADKRRLNAFTFGLLDALAQRLGDHDVMLRLLTYLHVALIHGPGIQARVALHEYLGFPDERELVRYVAGGRRHIQHMLIGNAPEPGSFADLLAEELLNR